MSLQKQVFGCARIMAIVGGMVLALLICLICLSVSGRLLNTILHGPFGAVFPDLSAWLLNRGVGPINGDFELVEAGIAFAIFAFLPLCQITSSHAKVDIFTSGLSEKLNRGLTATIEVVFAIVLIVIAVQLFDGMLSKRRYGETTFLLQFPVWWSYAISFFAACMAALVAVYVSFIRVVELAKMRTLLEVPEAADH